jgi:outer membrane protein
MFTKSLIALLAAPAIAMAQQQPAEGYRPITLAEAIKLAQENNVRAVTTGNAIRSANNLVRSTRANYLPSLSLSAGQSRSAGDRLGQNGTLVDYVSQWQYNTGMNAQVTLFDGGKTAADIRARRADVTAAEASQAASQADLAFQVKQQYNAVLAAKEAEIVARAALEAASQNLAMTVARVNAGASNVADSLNAVVTVGNAQIQILNSQQSLRVASGALTRLVSTPYFVTAIAADTADIPRLAIDSAAIMALALNGPNIRQFDAQLSANQAAQRSAKAAYLPTVSTSANIQGGATKNLYGFGGSSPYPYTRGISFSASYPIFNRYQRENAVQSAEINLQNTEANLRDAKLGNQQTILVQIGVMRNAEEKIRLQQISVRAAEEALRMNQQRYSVGMGTLIDVLNSQSQLVSARNALVSTRFEYRNARAQIEAVIGRDLP